MRILLDYRLQQAGIPTEQIQGYGNEETTYMAVAANVFIGVGRFGMGIFTVAKALA
ncbi:hypothetical protein DSUL_100097 [Desulfovibrionales bacterium]